MTEQTPIGRRTVLAGAGAAAGAVVLAACGGSGGDKADAGGETAGGTAGSSGGAGASAPAGALTPLAKVPVGGAVAAQTNDGKPVIVARPAQHDVVAFSAICTHMGCTVAPAGKILQCPCHGSQYDATTGDVIRGPAPRALAKLPVKVEDGTVVTDA